jgi:hypothetical protein
LYNIPINIDYEDYGWDLGNKQLIIISMQEINTLKSVNTKIELLDDYIYDKQNLVKSKLDKHVQQVKKANNALFEFFYTDFYS